MGYFIPTRYRKSHNSHFNRNFKNIDQSKILLSPQDEDLRFHLADIANENGYLNLRCQQDFLFSLHLEIADRMGLNQERDKKKCVVHSNGDKLDNRRENLKLISRSELSAQIRMRKKSLTPHNPMVE